MYNKLPVLCDQHKQRKAKALVNEINKENQQVLGIMCSDLFIILRMALC